MVASAVNVNERILGFLPARLRRIREDAGFSWTRLAQAAGVSERSIQSIEHGDVSPRIVTLARLASALAIPLNAFFVDADVADTLGR